MTNQLTPEEVEAIKREAQEKYPINGQMTVGRQTQMMSNRSGYIAAKIEERQRAKVLQTGFLAAIEVIKQWHNCDEVWDIYMNKAPEMKPIREALTSYNNE